MEIRNKFTCQNCNHTFPISELDTNPFFKVEGEDTCRMCMAHAEYEDNLNDYKAMHQAQELISDIWFERERLNIQFGICNEDLENTIKSILNDAGIEL